MKAALDIRRRLTQVCGVPFLRFFLFFAFMNSPSICVFDSAEIAVRELAGERVKLFQTHPGCRVFLGQIEACATGMDGLQRGGCHDVAILEPSWASDRNVQAVGRVARLGQPLPVRARMFALAGTVDRAVVRNHQHESTMRKGVLDADE